MVRRPKGTPVIVCDCVRPRGWPLLVTQIGKDNIAPSEQGFYAKWHVTRLQANIARDGEVWPIDIVEKVRYTNRITGNCRNCNRMFEIRLSRPVARHNFVPDEDHITYDEIDYRGCSMYDILDGLPANQEITTSPHIRIIPEHERDEKLKFYWIDLPFIGGTNRLWVNTLPRHRFAAFAHGFLDYAELLEWHPNAPDDQFREWRRQLEVMVKEDSAAAAPQSLQWITIQVATVMRTAEGSLISRAFQRSNVLVLEH